jgi:hypothetical protein
LIQVSKEEFNGENAIITASARFGLRVPGGVLLP